MKQAISESIAIPSGVSCEFSDSQLKCKKGSVELQRTINMPLINIKVESDKISFSASKTNKTSLKLIKSCLAHTRNLFTGLDKKYEYHLEACNVHFPMTLKVADSKLVINNFLGEKVPRYAVILPNVDVKITGQKILVTSHNKEAAGHTAANIEKATIVKNRDRRIFQDGIYITQRPGREI